MGSRSVGQGQSAYLMDEDVVCIRHILAQNVSVPHILPSVNQSLAWCCDAGDAVQQGVAEHHIGQCALIHVEPDISHAVRVTVVHQDDVLGTNLNDRWRSSFCFRSITVIHVQRFTISPSCASPDEFPAEVRMDQLVAASRVPENSCQHARYCAHLVRNA